MIDVQVIDLFSGCGGASCGFLLANTSTVSFKLLGGLDVDRYANETYSRMLKRPAIEMSARDLLDPVHMQRALRAWGYKKSKPLVLIGCAPCQGFSSHRKKDGRTDDRNDLVEVFGQVAAKLLPDVVVMENVPELLHQKNWKHFEAFRAVLQGAGYTVRARLHNAAQFGVPQERFRALVIATRDATRCHLPEPTHSPSSFRTVRDAIGKLEPLVAGGASAADSMHITSKHRPDTVALLKAIPSDGGSRSSLPANMVRDCHKSVDGFRDVYGRLWWDRPSVSITARCRTPSCGRFTHPEQHRGLSVREAALLQSFPGDWNFSGPFDDRYKQVGNAVPPLLAKAVAEAIDFSWSKGVNPASKELALDVNEAIARSISSSIAAWKKQARNVVDLIGDEK
ncbi:DNA cytosine methyltransferase [Stenotrophomonas rhizophila]|uniref:DNA cytosine methyltransferase n=1 Tax=Stenotrophomonas rhizophila TaxID=216778 RepID=UPI00224B8B77|nr:DNA cytosine methyltransferase [Stenotrophomonas rhizophila]MCX2921509.1 DNA cytosine methyltransferase [Stenotrophomonas rhizophila]